jgi:hypothetical protein
MKVSNQQMKVDFKYRKMKRSEQILDCIVISLTNSHCNEVLVGIICLLPGQAASLLTKTNQFSRIGEFWGHNKHLTIYLREGKLELDSCLLRDKNLRSGGHIVLT